MDRAFSRIVSASPQQRSGKRHQGLKQQVKSLRELRLIAGKAQADVATALQIKQPSVSKIETQVDMYLYVSVHLARLRGGDRGRVGIGNQAQGATCIAPLPAERCAWAHFTIPAARRAGTPPTDGDALAHPIRKPAPALMPGASQGTRAIPHLTRPARHRPCNWPRGGAPGPIAISTREGIGDSGKRVPISRNIQSGR